MSNNDNPLGKFFEGCFGCFTLVLISILFICCYNMLGYWLFIDLAVIIASFSIYGCFFSDEECDDALKSWHKSRRQFLFFDIVPLQHIIAKKEFKFDHENVWRNIHLDSDVLWMIFHSKPIFDTMYIIYSEKIKSFNKSFKVEQFYELNENQKWFDHFWEINDCCLKITGDLKTIYVKKFYYDNFENQNNLKVKYLNEIKKPIATKIIELVSFSQIKKYISEIVNEEELPNHLKIKKSFFVRSCFVIVPILVVVISYIINNH